MIEAGGYSRLIRFAEKWQKPEFPVKGGDLTALGFAARPEARRGAEDSSKANGSPPDFALDRAALLERAARRC